MISGANWQTQPTARVYSFSAARERQERALLATAERMAGGKLHRHDSETFDFWIDQARKERS
jgi:hypothetical protein